MQFAQICDRVETAPANASAPDVSALAGMWVNTNPETNGIARLLMSESGGNLSVQVYGIGTDGLIDWGTTNASLLTAAPSSQVAAGFTCRYDFGFAEAVLQAMILKGLIVLAQIHTFKDDSRRADYFVREYFALAHGRY